MKHIFRGFRSVYTFSFKNATKGLGFKLVTILVSLGIIALLSVLIVLEGKPEEQVSPLGVQEHEYAGTIQLSMVQKVFIVDITGNQVNLEEEIANYGITEYQQIEFDTSFSTKEDAIKASHDTPYSFVVEVTKENNTLLFDTAYPENTPLNEDAITSLAYSISSIYHSKLVTDANIPLEVLQEQNTPINVLEDLSIADEDDDSDHVINMLIKMMVPLIFGLMLYMMLLLYGGNISKSISIEKTSRLVETLLLSVHPYSLVGGKVLAYVTIALIQITSWIASVFIGLFVGGLITANLYPTAETMSLIEMIQYIQSAFHGTGFTLPAIILALLFFLSGFLLFSCIAGLAGSMVSKPEEAANAQGILQLPVVFGWLGSYIALLSENEAAMSVLRYVPFCSPFSVPAELLIGTVDLKNGLLMFLVLNVFTILLIILSGKLYKGLILYTGDKLTLKSLGKILKTN